MPQWLLDSIGVPPDDLMAGSSYDVRLMRKIMHARNRGDIDDDLVELNRRVIAALATATPIALTMAAAIAVKDSDNKIAMDRAGPELEEIGDENSQDSIR